MSAAPSVGDVIGAVADDVVAAKDELTRLDAVAGDGDLGITMATAGAALKVLLPELAGQDLATLLKRCGSELARKAPSTSGTLAATAFLRAGRAASDATLGGTALLAQLAAAAQQGIQERGKAAPGDKTMLDALAPAVAALQQAAGANAAIPAALADAARAARAGADTTRSMRAKVGRAGWLADRSVGHEDGGAYLVALIFASAARHLGAADRT